MPGSAKSRRSAVDLRRDHAQVLGHQLQLRQFAASPCAAVHARAPRATALRARWSHRPAPPSRQPVRGSDRCAAGRSDPPAVPAAAARTRTRRAAARPSRTADCPRAAHRRRNNPAARRPRSAPRRLASQLELLAVQSRWRRNPARHRSAGRRRCARRARRHAGAARATAHRSAIARAPAQRWRGARRCSARLPAHRGRDRAAAPATATRARRPAPRSVPRTARSRAASAACAARQASKSSSLPGSGRRVHRADRRVAGAIGARPVRRAARSTGTSGSTCHTENPASASQSMKRRAGAPSAPLPSLPQRRCRQQHAGAPARQDAPHGCHERRMTPPASGCAAADADGLRQVLAAAQAPASDTGW